ncbi:hypothetical protein GCM10009557_78940 [Virgisporangium ochraceum]|uniref:Uncharacterized protein n=2 Tax=Virgisporangium ochraceum TaxID=65505 RepID=A0A8J3ZS45_9ACTN|nr:hypothetical protein Voc01_029150 [Virgisporangium ochraceum]
MDDGDRLTDWAARLRAATDRAVREVLSTYPYEPDGHHVGPPATQAELAGLRERLPWVPDELVALHRHVGPVWLPDIGNGHFLHSVDLMVGAVEGGRADRIAEPLADSVEVVVFGSNGGGDLFAVATGDGRVYRLREAAYHGGVYSGTEYGVTVVGDDLGDHLDRLLAAVEAFSAAP